MIYHLPLLKDFHLRSSSLLFWYQQVFQTLIAWDFVFAWEVVSLAFTLIWKAKLLPVFLKEVKIEYRVSQWARQELQFICRKLISVCSDLWRTGTWLHYPKISEENSWSLCSSCLLHSFQNFGGRGSLCYTKWTFLWLDLGLSCSSGCRNWTLILLSSN